MRHILFFAGYRMKLFSISGARVVDGQTFEPGEEGFAAFEHYAQQYIRKPVRLLVDLIEEDFHLDTVPHVVGSDRKALHQRLLNKYLRNAEHRFIQVQGRETDGRKDDQVLVAGISNSELLKPWLNILDHCKIALAGIHSLPLLAQSALKPLGIDDAPTLLMTQQVETSFRHSLYLNGQLKVSRLAQALGDEQDSPAAIALREIEKTRRFFENQRLLATGERLQLCLLGNARFIHALKEQAQHEQKTHLINQLQFRQLPEDQDFAEVFFVEHLAQQRWQRNHYGHDQNLRIYYHKLAARSVLLLALLLFIAAIIATAYYLYLEQRERQATPQLIEQAEVYRQRYDARTGELAELQVEAIDVEYSVNALERMEQRYGQYPQQFLLALADASKDFIEVNYQDIQWRLRLPPLDPDGYGEPEPAGFQAELDGVLIDFADSPRKALQEVNSLIFALRDYPGFESVVATKMPFDIASNSQFTMDSSGTKQQDKQVAFSLSISGRLP